MESKKITVHFDEGLVELMDERREDYGISTRAELIRTAVKAYISARDGSKDRKFGLRVDGKMYL